MVMSFGMFIMKSAMYFGTDANVVGLPAFSMAAFAMLVNVCSCALT